MQQSTRRALALAGSSLGFAVVQLDVTVVNVAVASIRTELGGGVAGAQWVVNAYTIVFAALILTAGSLGDRLGARRLLVAGFVIFTAASVACGLAGSLGWLIAFRALQGVGAASLVPCSLSVLSHTFPDTADRARAVGVWAAGASIGLSGGPLAGGALIAASSWRLVFLINLPLGVLGAALVLGCATETSRSADAALDLPGQVLGVVCLGLLAAGTIEAGVLGFADPWVIGGYGVAASAGVAFVLTESRRRSPLLPLELFGSATFSAAATTGLVVNVAVYGLIFVLGLYFQEVRGYSPLATGLAFAPATASVLLANLVAGRLVRRYGARTVLMVAAGALTFSLAALLPTGRHTAYVLVAAPLVVAFAAVGIVVPAMTTALLGCVDPTRSGVASGVLNTARQTGSVVGVALFGAFAATSVVSGLTRALGVGAGLGVVAVGLGRLVDADSQ